MTDKTEVARIVAGLSEAQKRAIIGARDYPYRHAYMPAGVYLNADRRVLRNLSRLNIVRDYLNPHQQLTPLGLAVRRHLQENRDD